MKGSGMATDVAEQLDSLLEYLEERVDLDHARQVETLHLDAIMYRDVPFLPLSVSFPVDGRFTPFAYHEAFDDPEKMLFNELLTSFSSIYNSVLLKDHFPLHIRSNHGIGIIASLFGARCKIIQDNMPWVEHLDGMDAVREMVAQGLPDLESGLGSKVIATYRYFRDKLREYPKCHEAIRITQPDLQGPFDIAHLLIGTDIFYEVYDHAPLLHQLLELITETYIAFRRHIDELLTDRTPEDAVYVHGGIYGGKVILKDDTAAINLSQGMYDEFSKHYNDKILEAFGRGSLHYCGPGRDWHFDSMNCPWLGGLHFGNPEMHSLEYVYGYWSRRRVPILWWGNHQDYAFLDEVCRLRIPTGVTSVAKAANLEDARRIMDRHLARSG